MNQRNVANIVFSKRARFIQQGITIVEIMVALTIALILTYGVGQIYLSTKQTYRLQEAQARLQEGARYALDFLSHDIRLAGYLGCNSGAVGTVPLTLSITATAPLAAPILVSGTVSTCNAGIAMATVVTGGNDNTGNFACPNPALSATLNSNLVAGTDAITIQFAESCGAVTNNTAIPSGADPTASTYLTLPANCDFTTGSPALLIAQCGVGTDSADIFRSGQSVSRAYAANSEIMTFRSFTYFLRTNPNNQPALYRYDNNADINASTKTVELVEGVQDMQITYGVDTDADGGANQYLTSTEVSAIANAWFNVVGVRACLTMRSTDNYIVSSPQPYIDCTSGAVTTPNDRYFRRTIQSTISLRNGLANRPS